MQEQEIYQRKLNPCKVMEHRMENVGHGNHGKAHPMQRERVEQYLKKHKFGVTETK